METYTQQHISHESPLRVLMTSDVYFPRINGVSTSMATFRSALLAHGIDVRLVVPRYGLEGDEEGIVRVAGRAVPGDPEDRMVGWRAMREAVRSAAADCDVLHVQTPFVAHYAGLAAARALQLPRVLTYHTFFEEYLHHYVPWLPSALLRSAARRLSRSQCNQMDAVVVPSTAMRDRLLEYGVTRPMHVLPTGVPMQDFMRGDGQRFRARHGIAADARLALYVGRVAHEKNIGFLLDVAQRMQQLLDGFVLVIAGEGPGMEALQGTVRARGLQQVVRFIGYLERAHELPDCYASADAFVFASLTETQGLVLIEAMAAGVPVVALAAMGTCDILAARRGALVLQASIDEFTAALHRLMLDDELRARLSSEARQYAAEWSDHALAGRLAYLYRSLAQAQGAPSAHANPTAPQRAIAR